LCAAQLAVLQQLHVAQTPAPTRQAHIRKDAKYSLKASYVEIYNEGVYDLVHFNKKSLPVKWDAAYGFYVQVREAAGRGCRARRSSACGCRLELEVDAHAARPQLTGCNGRDRGSAGAQGGALRPEPHDDGGHPHGHEAQARSGGGLRGGCCELAGPHSCEALAAHANGHARRPQGLRLRLHRWPQPSLMRVCPLAQAQTAA
jgi:hypothetical protein